MEYLNHWSLLRKPFAVEDDHVFFAGVPQREALAGLSYFVGHGLPSAFLVAENRCGTSSLLRYVKRMRGFGDSAAEMILTDGIQPSYGAAEAALCRALGYAGAQGEARSQINEALEVTCRQGVQTIWLIDRCCPPAARVARELTQSHPGFSFAIATSPKQTGKLAVELGRCPMRIDLIPLSIEDTIEYLQYCVEHAGGDRRLFPDNAAVRLHEITGGALADLAVAAESALALAASHQMNEVTPAIIEAIDEQVRRAA
jgi:hypothetical protein